MKKILKWTGITLGGLFLLLLILPFAFSGKIESAIKDAANENLNARVNWSDVSLSLIRNFPNLRISIENLTVDNTTYPFDSVRMASIGSLEAVVDFKSLFGDQITIKRITQAVNDCRICLQTHAHFESVVKHCRNKRAIAVPARFFFNDAGQNQQFIGMR